VGQPARRETWQQGTSKAAYRKLFSRRELRLLSLFSQGLQKSVAWISQKTGAPQSKIPDPQLPK
jgi:hypothetical protein